MRIFTKPLSIQPAVRETPLAQRLAKLLRPLLMSTALFGSALAFAVEEQPEPVNINTDNAVTLAAGLNGIGLRRAEQIVEYREANGPFKDPYELTVIKGVGERIVERNEARIRLRD